MSEQPETPAVAPPSPRFNGVERIAVLRAGGLGDLLFAQPALEALAAAYPAARVTLIGARAAAELFGAGAPRSGGVPHEVAQLPPEPGLTLPDDAARPPETGAFLAEHAARGYDLAVQVHGGGRFANPFLGALGARHTVGARTPDAAPLERALDYAYYQHEVLRALEIAGLAGAAPVRLEPRVAVADDERERADRALAGEGPLVAIHPGATDPRRRWPAERFAALARDLVARGVRILLVGDAGDRALCGRIREAAGADGVRDAAGALSLRQLAAALAVCDAFVGNDSGPRHLAQAVGTPTVSVYWFGNLINAGPLGRGRHRVHLGWTTTCPVCGRDSTQVGWTAERCAHDPSFVADVAVRPVRDDALRLVGA